MPPSGSEDVRENGGGGCHRHWRQPGHREGHCTGSGQQGATVYATGRSLQPGASRWPGTVTETAQEVTRLGGVGIAAQCDHRKDGEVKTVFQRVQREQDRLDLLVNNATSFGETPSSYGYDPEVDFWELPIEQWDEMQLVGLRSHYVASVFAAPMMIERRSGLILNISSSGAVSFAGNVAYGVGKAAVDKLAADMAHQLRRFDVAAISLWPPLIKTEKVVAFSERYNLARALSPVFIGRIVAALAMDPKIMEKTGRALKVTELATEYGLTDTPADTSPRSPSDDTPTPSPTR